MSYCTNSQVRAIVETDITDAEIDELIFETDALMDATLGAGLAAAIAQVISRTWTALRCMLKDPSSERLGEQQYDRTTSIKMLRDELQSYMSIATGGISLIAQRDPL